MLERAVAVDTPSCAAIAEWLAVRKEIVVWWTASRVIVFSGAFALHLARVPHGYFGPAIFRPLFGPLEAWDGVWYRLIATHGYLLVSGRQSDPAFFPLYPLLMKIVAATGLPLAAAGVLLSNVLFLGALLAFDGLSTDLFDRARARRATLLLAVFPTTYVCSMIYPESLILLAYSLAGWCAIRRRWGACAITSAVAALARPEGILLALPILGCLVAQWRSLEPEMRGRGVGAVLAGRRQPSRSRSTSGGRFTIRSPGARRRPRGAARSASTGSTTRSPASFRSSPRRVGPTATSSPAS